MGVTVYPRLEELLRERNLTPADLSRRIEEQFGLVVDPSALDPLTQAEPIGQADMRVAGAAAHVLGVELGDLFEVKAEPADLFDVWRRRYLTPAQNERLEALLCLSGTRARSESELAEVEDLLRELS